MAQRILVPATCKVCGEVFYGPAEGLGGGRLIVGEDPKRRDKLYMATLIQHIEAKHPGDIKQARMLGAEYAGMLALAIFQTTDEGVNQQRDYQRWRVHQNSIALRVTNERIDARVQETFDRVLKQHEEFATAFSSELSELAEAMKETMRVMRDVLEEVDRYPSLTDEEPESAVSTVQN